MKTLLLVSSLIFVSYSTMASIEQIDTAANTLNIAELKQYSVNAVDYEKAYANYRLAITANIVGQIGLAAQSLNSAQLTLETILNSHANADTQALLAAVYGMQIAVDNSKGTEYGMKAATLLQQANQLEPQNPRVSLVRAINAFYTPSIMGGGLDKTTLLATQAIEQFDLPCDTFCWGHAEAYTWRGLAKQEQGDLAGAMQDWQTALTVDKQYGWANFLLNQQSTAQ
ncbi:hypothetical protein [Shewanella holmiensis]|jgi:tetratricopeptide (TPR) repeat protein|uniref:Tetratricopeptide repeat protein n=1 Tax=Shewanella holmiensis TaxID=2952222 RepID=A0A9X2WLR9_9GAMM|nr:hypothetical protein [Shewanella holmiensis]MCT7941262.1 hypothetical protein [Shewanella holmiensis]